MTPLRYCSTRSAATLLLAVAVPVSAADEQRDPLLATQAGPVLRGRRPDGDGIADIAVVDFLTDTLWVLAGDERGGFARTATLQVGDGPRPSSLRTSTGMGGPDLAVASFLEGEITLLLGTGAVDSGSRS